MTAAADIVWNGMARAELDAAYNNGAAVANSADKIADWIDRSARLRARHPDLLDRVYGPRPRNRIDLFRCGRAGAPLFAFIHGGYWQRNSKETFACMAEGPLARGCDAALIGYTLAPNISVTGIVAEIHAAIRWLRREGVATGRLVVSGWSAGAHLTAMAMSLPEVSAGLSISGIFDVEPCRLNYLNDKLNLTEAEAVTMSPIRHLVGTRPLALAFGTAELPELQRQSRDYAQARQRAGLPVDILPLEGLDHFSILEELARPDGVLATTIARLAGLP